MADDKKEPWLNWLALTTIIFAVCATLSTFKGAGFSSRSLMSQSQASDQWAFYQAKAIKGYLYQMQLEKLDLELRGVTHLSSPDVADAYREKIADYHKKVDKYEQEKLGIQQEAKHLELVRDEAQIHAKDFGIAVIYLQIAILLSSIAGLLKKKLVWASGIATGLVGLIYFADGFFVLF
ncbi:MAG: DUF4337 domain-containing protein [Sulfurimicrobium sp.]|nr:DUF4337 domain-containing protein [Sulfurimicrobium sp.]MDP1704464.1 DUF4337 domain-containing protein [Sulfurimicrobium sp.]MDP2199072.1 DUF4337 domain-containing protein [Sulfurimicrobium sp.]MDP3686121.1 DUF4337 domain-containing protein [Sulfurimicrobium sp.]